MGMVTVQTETTKYPISLIGKESGICYGSNIQDPTKNYNRGLENIKSNHGRTLEFPQVYLTLEGYSAKVIREFYTHIAGGPTRLQSSTRYIEYGNFEYIIPHTIENNNEAKSIYMDTMEEISRAIKNLESLDIPREDASMLLPLGMETKIVVRTNLRNLVDMSHQRMCNRAYWEFRELFNQILKELSFYSSEWKVLIEDLNLFIPKCKLLGHCPETHSCKGDK